MRSVFQTSFTPVSALNAWAPSSIVYAIALFRGEDDVPCAIGRFVHVYVDRETRRPVPIPDVIRQVAERLK